jgi:hypothetical protein
MVNGMMVSNITSTIIINHFPYTEELRDGPCLYAAAAVFVGVVAARRRRYRRAECSQKNPFRPGGQS